MLKSDHIFRSGAILLVSLLFFLNATANVIPQGFYKAQLQLNDSTVLPFSFEVKYDAETYTVTFINGEERISTSEIAVRKDSVFIRMPVFDSEFKIRMEEGNAMTGLWINHARKDKNVIPFRAIKVQPDGVYTKKTDSIFHANSAYEVTFSENSKDSYKAKGVFREWNFSYTSGTFLTETGDYRYLSGTRSGDNFSMSCFDGSHAFLFTGKVKGDSIVEGHFYSGAHWHEPWVAKRNDTFELRDPDSLTYMKPGFTKVDFSFKNLEGKTVSLSDEKYKNKVVLIQIMGSWCPNCMDETKFLAPFYDKYNRQGLEVIGLAFERTDDFNKAVANVSRLKTRFNANYDFLITMKTGAQQASDALPMLNGIMAFPTTIYIDKKGVVRKVYTGFSGPATGHAYTKYVEDTTNFVEKLLRE
ncbi:MAG: peroxiredoxin family protein [Bacteroidia bacterium]